MSRIMPFILLLMIFVNACAQSGSVNFDSDNAIADNATQQEEKIVTVYKSPT